MAGKPGDPATVRGYRLPAWSLNPRVSLKDKAKAWIHSKHMLPATGVISLLESTVLPIPLEVLLVPAMQARRDRLWLLAAVALGGCLLGATLGWFIGYALMDTVGRPAVEALGYEQGLEDAKTAFNENGFLYVLGISLAPVPFQIAMLAAGAAKYSIWKFLLATLISRAIRYFGLALLVWWLGDRAEGFVKKHKTTTAVVTFLVVAAVFAWTLWG